MDAHEILPETVETLLDWKLPNVDKQFNDEEFLSDFEQHAEEANALFEAAFLSDPATDTTH